MGKAKLTGQIIDRAEVGEPNQFDDMTDEQLFEKAKGNRHGYGDTTMILVGFVTLVGLAGGALWPLASMMTKISYNGYRFPPVIIQQAIWL